MRRSFRFIVVAAIAIACDEPSEMHLVDRASSLLITGTLQLGRIGEVSQLRATAIYPDGRRIDVTQAAEWNTAASQIASVDAGGVLTARGFGLGGVTAFFYPVRQTLQVIVTPPGTFILAGRVREPGAGSLSAVTVRHIASGDSAITGNDGRYSLAGVPHPAQLSLTKPGYEPADLLA